MTPELTGPGWVLHHGDALDVLAGLPDRCVDAVVTDPPYGLRNLPGPLVADTVGRWLAGDREHVPSGRGYQGRAWDRFVPPPALWDQVRRVLRPGGYVLASSATRTADLMGLSMRLAGLEPRDTITWVQAQGMPKGRGALRPAAEPVLVARAPGGRDGGLDTDGNRVGGPGGRTPANVVCVHEPGCEVTGQQRERVGGGASGTSGFAVGYRRGDGFVGRTVTVPLFSCAPGCAVSALDEQAGARVSRFFFAAKASRHERPTWTSPDGRQVRHVCVKPLALVSHLLSLAVPTGGTVLDPFAGTGTTLAAAVDLGLTAVGIEGDPDSVQLVAARAARTVRTA